MESLSWETVLHELLQCESLPWATVLHELLQHGSLPWGAVLQEQTAPVCVPHGITSPDRKPTLAQASHRVTASFRAHPTALVWGPPRAAGGYLVHHEPPWAAGGQPASPWSSPWTAGESLLWHLEHLLPLLLH